MKSHTKITQSLFAEESHCGFISFAKKWKLSLKGKRGEITFKNSHHTHTHTHKTPKPS
jgi:hypothetical protein